MASQMSLLYPADYDRTKENAMKNFQFIQSLQIDDMIVLVKESYRGFADLSLEKFFSSDPKVLKYRLAVVKDLVENDKL